MRLDEWVARAHGPAGLTLAIDTNIDWERQQIEDPTHPSGWRKVPVPLHLANLANRARAMGLAVRVVVPALVVVEREAQERRARGVRYDRTKVRDALISKGLDVIPLDLEAALDMAAWLSERAPTAERWSQLKRESLARTVGPVAGTPPTSTDWILAAHSATAGWGVVTHDRGDEWAGVPTLRAADAVRVLDRLLAP